jgi:hypothetical protein
MSYGTARSIAAFRKYGREERRLPSRAQEQARAEESKDMGNAGRAESRENPSNPA